MTIREPREIHPKLAETVRSQLQGFTFSQPAQDVIDSLLASGTKEITSQHMEIQDDMAGEVTAKLMKVLPSIASELGSYAADGQEISEETLNSVLTGYCPCPPFCYGGKNSAPVPAVDQSPFVDAGTVDESVKVPTN